jgi:hypothetical protein
MLAFLMHGLDKYRLEESFLNGSPWLLTCFFLVRIPKLCQAIELHEPLDIPNDKSPMNYILGRIQTLSFNHKNCVAMGQMVRNVLETVTDEVTLNLQSECLI